MHSRDFCLIVCALLAGAIQQASATDQIEQQQPSTWQWLEGRRDDVSRGVAGFGRRIDAWLAGETIGDNENETYLRIRFHQQAGSFGGYHSKLNVGGTLDLPQTSERWRLVFESDDEDLNSLEDTVLGEQQSNDAIGGFRYLHDIGGDWEVSHDIGLRAKFSADPYYRLRARNEYQLNTDWSVGLSQKIWYYDSDGWGYDTDMSFNRQLSDEDVFRIHTEVKYQQHRNAIEFAQAISLHRPLAEQETLSYSLGVLGINKPNIRINAYYTEARYRRAMREDWLFMEIVPQILVDRDENWRPEPRLLVNFEMMFFDF